MASDAPPPCPVNCGDRLHYYDPSVGLWMVQLDRNTWATIEKTPEGVLFVNSDLFDYVMAGELPS